MVPPRNGGTTAGIPWSDLRGGLGVGTPRSLTTLFFGRGRAVCAARLVPDGYQLDSEWRAVVASDAPAQFRCRGVMEMPKGLCGLPSVVKSTGPNRTRFVTFISRAVTL